MKKFVMALAIFAMGGAALFGVLNKKVLDEEIRVLGETKDKVAVVTKELTDTQDKLADTKEEESRAKDARDQVAAKVSETEQTKKRLLAQVEGVNGELETTNIKQKEIDLAIRKVFPDGQVKTANEIRQMRQMLADQLAEKQSTKAELQAKLTGVAAEMTSQQGRVKEGEAHQIRRAQSIALNGLEATVIAVNREWGFIMVNAGRNYGVAPDASMLVKRGNQRVARLRIVALQDDSVVCDVIPESLVEGVKISPGDRVIFENTK